VPFPEQNGIPAIPISHIPKIPVIPAYYHSKLRIEKVNARRVQLNARVHDPGV
jgi:hypothetical protein